MVVVHRAPYPTWVLENGSCEVGLEEAEVEEEGKEHLADVHDGSKMWEERGQEVDSDRRGFGIKQILSGLSLSPCLLAQADKGGESGEGDGLLQGLNTLVQGLESPQVD